MKTPRWVRAGLHHLGRLFTFLYLAPGYAAVAACVVLTIGVFLVVLAAPIFAWVVAGDWAWHAVQEKDATLFISDLPYAYYPDKRGCALAKAVYERAGERNVECRSGNRN